MCVSTDEQLKIKFREWARTKPKGLLSNELAITVEDLAKTLDTGIKHIQKELDDVTKRYQADLAKHKKELEAAKKQHETDLLGVADSIKLAHKTIDLHTAHLAKREEQLRVDTQLNEQRRIRLEAVVKTREERLKAELDDAKALLECYDVHS